MAAEGRWTGVGTGRVVGADGEYVGWRPDNRRADQHCMYADTADDDSGRWWHDDNYSVRPRHELSLSGRWNDGHCHAARLNFVCEIVITP